MKKTYQKPELSVFSTGFQLMDITAVSDPLAGKTTSGAGLTGGNAKDRDDEEIYESEGDTYGDLW